MTRGQIAEHLNVNPETIRYYEKIGLIVPMFKENNYRHYDEKLCRKLELILSFKNFGFSLKEIKTFFSIASTSSDDPGRFNFYLTRKIENIDKKIESLIQLKQSLTLFKDKEDKENCRKFSIFLNNS